MEALPTDRAVKKITVTMPCHLGLHARTAVQFIYFTRQFKSEILIRKGKHEVDGKSILGLLTLGATFNSTLDIIIEGDDAHLAIEAVEKYFLDSKNCIDNSS